jgi:hypothetical protein
VEKCKSAKMELYRQEEMEKVNLLLPPKKPPLSNIQIATHSSLHPTHIALL